MSDNLSDLEQLLEDLGRPKSVTVSKGKPRSSVVNLSELEALMSDLADSPAPPPAASKPPPQRAAVVSTQFERAPVAAKPAQPRSTVVSTSFEADDLDSIMNALNGGSIGGGGGGNVHVEISNGHHGHGGHDHHDHHHNHDIDVDLDFDEQHDIPDHHHHHEHHHHDHHDHHEHHHDHHDHHHGNGHGHAHGGFDIDLELDDIPLPPKASAHAAKAAPAPARATMSRDTTNTIDELEDLLNGLDDNNASARSSARLSISAKAPASAPASNPRLSISARPAATVSASHAHTPAAPHLANSSGTFGANARVNASAPAPASGNSNLSLGLKVGGGGQHHTPANQHSNLSLGLNVHAGGGAAPRASPAAAAKPNNTPFVANPQPRPANNSNALDALLGDLQTQLHAVPDPSSPASNGMCAACGRGILGEVITASGKRFHPEHFVCGNCQNPLGTSNFYEQDGVAHCERCYQELLCPRCGHCDEPILDRCVTAMGKKWHLDHFVCTQCLNPFRNGSFFERDGRAFCDGCFATAFAPRCGGCSQPINGPCINAVGQSWHPEHFVCQFCHKAFSGSFYEFGGKPYCDLHYHQQTGSLCAGCGKAVAGKCVDALGKKWHPEHFVCAFCMNMLAAGSFTENSGKAYCKDCHGKLFG